MVSPYLPLCSLCPLWLEKRSLTHKEDKRRFALEEKIKLTSMVTSLSSHSFLFVKIFRHQSTLYGLLLLHNTFR